MNKRKGAGMDDQHRLSESDEDSTIIGPAEFPPPVPEDLLGRRIAGALIDLVVLVALLVILSAATGGFRTSATSFIVALDGAWIGVFLLLVLLYYLVLEAWAGQTLGKLLLDVRVLRAGGTRPSLGAIALRTLLRAVDWLPLLYLAGFTTMLATGTRRQRIGDLAARTVMGRAGRPARNRNLALLPLAGVLLAAIILPVSRSNSAERAQTYTGNGVSFAYPAGWSVGTPHGITATGDLLWTAVVGPGTQQDVILIEGFRLKAPVTTQNIEAIVPDLARLIQDNGYIFKGSPQAITMAGLPGVQFDVTNGTGGSRQSRLVLAFSGTTEYSVNCQYTHARAAEIQQGCDQVLSTFRVP